MDSSRSSNSANDILLHLVFDHAAGQAAIESSNIAATVCYFDEISKLQNMLVLIKMY